MTYSSRMATIRLDNQGRRSGIVAAAMPLFARKGFAGTTTKEIAEAAHVSEALVFKHFPSKAALYGEILQLGCQGDPALERIGSLIPSTATLIDMVHFMLRHFVLDASATGDMDVRQRLMLNSFLEDGEYGRLVCDWVLARVYPKIEECLLAAEAAGDLVALPIALENRFWFGQHVAAMMAYVRLSGRSAVPYRGEVDDLIVQAAWFILRGFGLKDAVIAAHKVPPPGACGGNGALRSHGDV
jgi:TetR/AcrR family transcriptional regulator, transcriptional repressor of aconitase